MYAALLVVLSACRTMPVDPPTPSGSGRRGTYRVEAQLSGYEPRRVKVEVTPEQTTSVAVQLEAEEPIWTKWWLWTAAAVVVGGVVAATVVATSPSDVTVCHPVGGNGC